MAVMLAAGQMELLRTEGFLFEGEDDGDFGTDFPRFQWHRKIEETAAVTGRSSRGGFLHRAPSSRKGFRQCNAIQHRQASSCLLSQEQPRFPARVVE